MRRICSELKIAPQYNSQDHQELSLELAGKLPMPKTEQTRAEKSSSSRWFVDARSMLDSKLIQRFFLLFILLQIMRCFSSLRSAGFSLSFANKNSLNRYPDCSTLFPFQKKRLELREHLKGKIVC